ncbi:Rieske 2Fe-2S domain-containing protein [Sorangium sp. So ce1335]|uniref:Rieske 2Fe-2S domain-containing protein n=1 Tax=Sorangium sp. So ce1335 TaxID=3133335 RepID=UPI003F5E3C32
MFEGFANVWTPVALAADLRADRSLAVQVAGTPLVLLRDRDGKPSALLDRCPHRGVALSLGRVKDGCLECAFHGWQIEASGQVCHVPWNPDAKLSALRGVAFPARELAGPDLGLHRADQPAQRTRRTWFPRRHGRALRPCTGG